MATAVANGVTITTNEEADEELNGISSLCSEIQAYIEDEDFASAREKLEELGETSSNLLAYVNARLGN